MFKLTHWIVIGLLILGAWKCSACGTNCWGEDLRFRSESCDLMIMGEGGKIVTVSSKITLIKDDLTDVTANLTVKPKYKYRITWEEKELVEISYEMLLSPHDILNEFIDVCNSLSIDDDRLYFYKKRTKSLDFESMGKAIMFMETNTGVLDNMYLEVLE